MTSTRHHRRSLDRRSNQAFARVRGGIIAADTARDVALLHEDGDMRVIEGHLAPTVLQALGLTELHREIESRRASHARGWIPVVVIIDGYAALRWTETHPLSRGGDA